nr:unnamed protein product [Callosobruchus chinensis]
MATLDTPTGHVTYTLSLLHLTSNIHYILYLLIRQTQNRYSFSNLTNRARFHRMTSQIISKFRKPELTIRWSWPLLDGDP